MYATVEQLKHYLGITTRPDDALLSALLERAQTLIDTSTRRTFECSTATTRTFDAVADVKGPRLWLDDDLAAITSVTNGDGVVVTSGQYVTEPRRSTPYYALKLLASSNVAWTYTTDPEGAIAIVGKWAYSLTAPEDIQHACIRLAAFLYRQKDTAVDVDRPLLAGDGNVIMPTTLPGDVMAILNNYLRVAP